jgi:hypothetical protein
MTRGEGVHTFQQYYRVVDSTHRQTLRISLLAEQIHELLRDRFQRDLKMDVIFERMLKALEQISADKGSGPPAVEEKKVQSAIPTGVRVFLPSPGKDGGAPSSAGESAFFAPLSEYEPSA